MVRTATPFQNSETYTLEFSYRNATKPFISKGVIKRAKAESSRLAIE